MKTTQKIDRRLRSRAMLWNSAGGLFHFSSPDIRRKQKSETKFKHNVTSVFSLPFFPETNSDVEGHLKTLLAENGYSNLGRFFTQIFPSVPSQSTPHFLPKWWAFKCSNAASRMTNRQPATTRHVGGSTGPWLATQQTSGKKWEILPHAVGTDVCW